jgi:hypothetical protein
VFRSRYRRTSTGAAKATEASQGHLPGIPITQRASRDKGPVPDLVPSLTINVRATVVAAPSASRNHHAPVSPNPTVAPTLSRTVASTKAFANLSSKATQLQPHFLLLSAMRNTVNTSLNIHFFIRIGDFPTFGIRVRKGRVFWRVVCCWSRRELPAPHICWLTQSGLLPFLTGRGKRPVRTAPLSSLKDVSPASLRGRMVTTQFPCARSRARLVIWLSLTD